MNWPLFTHWVEEPIYSCSLLWAPVHRITRLEWTYEIIESTSSWHMVFFLLIHVSLQLFLMFTHTQCSSTIQVILYSLSSKDTLGQLDSKWLMQENLHLWYVQCFLIPSRSFVWSLQSGYFYSMPNLAINDSVWQDFKLFLLVRKILCDSAKCSYTLKWSS